MPPARRSLLFLWSYPGSQHDYNPYWDYDPDEDIEDDLKAFVIDYIDNIKADIFPEVGFLEDIRVAFVKLENDEIAKYIDGTEPYVVMVIDINKIKSILEEMHEYEILEDHIKVTIVHELAHAIQQGMDLYYDEEEAEDFARNYVDYNEITRFWDELV